MKAVKILVILFLVYAGIVVAFESLIGYFQPTDDNTLVITTTDAGGESSDRVLSSLKMDDKLYVAANHWPRAWYREALENPQVQVKVDGEAGDYRAVPVTDQERERLNTEHELGMVVKILTGFPPRRFLRLEPA
ncbi:MAG: nitroreductase/quinone reductase family protein [Gammaproteobacteria bacterium]|nr:nitroreductase/quinone reductase family protein [Gammaproteobacteria bacterium]